MKNYIVLFSIAFVLGSFGNVLAQNVPGVPNGSIANNSRDDYDNGTRIRSMEMERIKKENYRSAAAAKSAENRKINYSQIKKDFELVQKLQNAIIQTYVTGKQINYRRIGELAVKLNECADRLDKNLLLSTEKPLEKSDKKNFNSKDVKDIIVILDNLIGKFVVNPIFKNLHIFEATDAEKAEFNLHSIIDLSNLLAQKTQNQR